MEEKIHKYRALPHNGRNQQGDCGPCCLGAILELTVNDVYDNILGYVDGMTYDRMVKALWRKGVYFENYIPSDAVCDNNPEWFTFGRPSWRNFIRWFDLTKQRLNYGLVGIAQVNMRGNAHNDDFTDHWVIIYGYKQKSENAVDKVVLISCPTRGEFEIDAKTFLRQYGGYNTIWVQPSDGKI